MFGVIQDEKSNEVLTAASILVVGTSLGGTTDLDGRFSIRDIPAGTYDIRITCAGYNPKTVPGFLINEGEPVELNVKLRSIGGDAYVIDDMVVTAERVLSTAAAVLANRKRSAIIGDAISAEQISRSPDATSGEALKRVTGLSVVDDKYVFIRGVTDRYNGTALNGVSVTSTDTDADKKSFSYDLVPASLLSNTVVAKTATPDLPGDFSGGFVQVNTLDFPDDMQLKLTYGQSYNELTSQKDFYSSEGGEKDWYGRDDGSRALPAEDLSGNALARKLPNNWRTRGKEAPLNQKFNIAYGDNYWIGDHELGLVAALTYGSSFKTKPFVESPSFKGTMIAHFEGTHYTRSILWGGLVNLNYKPHPLHKISFKNNYVQSAEEKISFSEGLPETGQFRYKQTIEWDQRNLYLGQLSGDHKLPFLNNLQMEWQGYRSTSEAEEPDRKHVEFEQGAGDWFAFKDNYRTWSQLADDSEGMGADLTLPLSGWFDLKAGILNHKMERTYDITAYSTDPSSVRRPNYGLLVLPVETVFDPDNYGDRKFSFVPVTVFTGEYSGTHDLLAYYGMIDYPFSLGGQRFRLVGGARVEESDQVVNTVKSVDDPTPIDARVKEKDVLPSLNLTYQFNDKTNLRLAYYKSVNRPEFRELANVLYYDFNRIQNVIGNPDLKRAVIKNFDARLEIFPGLGEVIAVSYFYKDLENAIEERLIPSPERFLRTWFNSPVGHNYGWEIEARKSFGFIHGYGKNFSLAGNYTRIWSSIEYKETKTDKQGKPVTTVDTRVMQGQSPWTVNVSFQYFDPRIGTSVTLLYNNIGRRLSAVGDSRDEDIYHESRDLLDLAINQKFLGHWAAKFTIRNLLESDEIYTVGPDEETFAEYKQVTSYAFSMSYNF
ncbi:MAG: TonB-dependent receptor [Candidatus Krumholzibacteriota bacterium]|nr:TonB-dependent receptor [Candidatus Krumholzibacteriota bacterium]